MSFLINLNVRDTLSSRSGGVAARHKILSHLNRGESVEIDFGNRPMSPSFADECLGILVHDIGIERFKSLVTVKNMSGSSKRLVQHVIAKRVSLLTAA